jgi:hypothetical protein
MLPMQFYTELFYNKLSGRLTNIMELSVSWEATSSSATQEFLNILWNHEVLL